MKLGGTVPAQTHRHGTVLHRGPANPSVPGHGSAGGSAEGLRAGVGGQPEPVGQAEASGRPGQGLRHGVLGLLSDLRHAAEPGQGVGHRPVTKLVRLVERGRGPQDHGLGRPD